MSNLSGWAKLRNLPHDDPRRERAKTAARIRWHLRGKHSLVGQRKRKRHHPLKGRPRSPLSTQDRYLRRHYGITQAEYDQRFIEQNGRCAVCKRPEFTTGKLGKLKRLSVDHCHASTRVRGLLCQACNAGIGLLQENPAVLSAAISYLQKVLV
jgi:recombination endonuclease VII